MSQVTTHILDTALGTPASGVTVVLYEESGGSSNELARGVTNADGRIGDLLKNETLKQGVYKMRFETKAYFEKITTRSFYPFVEIVFEISSGEHYHIPLLLSPFGYATYRGS